MSKEDFARLITIFIQSQVGVRELGTRPIICVPGVFFPCVPELIEICKILILRRKMQFATIYIVNQMRETRKK